MTAGSWTVARHDRWCRSTLSEWLISRGRSTPTVAACEINAYPLGREARFSRPASEMIAHRVRPLRLHRVTDVQPGAGTTLIDEFDPAGPSRSRCKCEISGMNGMTRNGMEWNGMDGRMTNAAPSSDDRPRLAGPVSAPAPLPQM